MLPQCMHFAVRMRAPASTRKPVQSVSSVVQSSQGKPPEALCLGAQCEKAFAEITVGLLDVPFMFYSESRQAT